MLVMKEPKEWNMHILAFGWILFIFGTSLHGMLISPLELQHNSTIGEAMEEVSKPLTLSIFPGKDPVKWFGLILIGFNIFKWRNIQKEVMDAL